jgi:acyl-CoA reductase-like NAD-dependent aldehyde dehydrogenase
MPEKITCISPVDGSVYVSRPVASKKTIATTFAAARAAQEKWRRLPLAERAAYCSAAVDAMVAMKDEIVPELAWQMGRPIRYGAGELRGFEERARYMIDIAEQALADIHPGPKEGFVRYVRRDPLGVVFTIAPWNYPYLTAVNSVIPALIAGNTVVLKHAASTLLVAERFQQAFDRAELPEGVFQHLVLSHAQVGDVIAGGLANMVCFTGSVAGGKAMEEASAGRFINVGLELGGKDPAYVAPDADLDHAVANLVDGAFYNAGQSCCGIERIYVHRSVYDRFVDGALAEVRKLRMGDPMDAATTVGPMAQPGAPEKLEAQVEEARAKGGRVLCGGKATAVGGKGRFFDPCLIADATHQMHGLMVEESFGPIVGVAKVAHDDEAVRLMNDSPYGLTAAVWTRDQERAFRIGSQIETGTFFMNRCDYLDPALPWTGVKDSGKGNSLSRYGFLSLTRRKSFHLRTQT